ncbi:hypothetical protein [Trichothermofontia sp.]
MTQPNLVALAQQGNPRAIAALVNQHLQPQGIQARVTVKSGNLHLLLESKAVPDRHTHLEQITHLFLENQIHAFATVMVYGRKQGEKQPAWQDRVDLTADLHTVLDSEGPDFSFTAEPSAAATSATPPPSPSEPDTLLQYDREATAASNEAAVSLTDLGDIADREPFGDGRDTNGSEAGPTSAEIPADFAAFDLGRGADQTDKFRDLEDNYEGNYEDTDEGDLEGPEATDEDAEGEEETGSTEATAQPWYIRKLGLIIGGIALVVVAILGIRFWLNQQSVPGETPLPVESPPQSPVATPAGGESPALPATSPAASPVASPAADPFREAVNRATSAAQLTQTARTRQEWETVAAQWREAIALMQAVPADSPNYATAQDRAVAYQKNLTYAEQVAASRPE